ncbi:MAG: SemiSWEET family transporter [Candidatus Altiarchaeota archaeon]
MVLRYVGWLAVAVTAAQFIPQVIKGYRTKSLKDVSGKMYVLVVVSTILWMTHGIYTRDPVIITANIMVFLCALAILYLKHKYG